MRIFALCSVAVAVLAVPALAGEFKADFEKAGLVVDGRKAAPSSVQQPPPEGIVVGKHRLLVNGPTLVARWMDGTPAWSWSAPTGTRPGIAGMGEDVLLIHLFKKVDDDEWERVSPSTVHRARLEDGGKLPSLRIPETAAEERIRDLLVTDRGTIALSLVEGPPEIRGENIRQYRVTCFKDDGKVRWSKLHQSAGRVRGASAVLLGGGGPSYAGPGVLPLSVIREDVIVCAGGGEDILALDRATGEERWRLGAVWEYERGFVGPSVWSHYIYRKLGPSSWRERRELSDDELEALQQQDSARLRKMRRIVAGPVVVPHRGGDGAWNREEENGYRLFVATARDSDEATGGYLSHAFVYEINHKGDPIAVLPLPRMPRGTFRRGQEAVWLCEAGGIGATAPSFQQQSSGMGGGGTDHVGRLAWWRQPGQFELPECWMATGRTGDHLVVHENLLYRVPAGGYVLNQQDNVYRFPITRLDLATGAQSDLLLQVSFRGSVPDPEGSFSRSSSPDGSVSWKVGGPHLLAITDLTVTPNGLTITLGTSGGEAADLSFTLQ